MHYARWLKHGNPLHPSFRDKTPEQRFWERVDVGDCWEWTGGQRADGYGRCSFRGRQVYVHRCSWEQLVRQPIPDGWDLDHLCRNRRCVNPDHLEPVTHGENTLRGNTFQAKNAAKTHCPQGHPYSKANTRVSIRTGRLGNRPQRLCRACEAGYNRRRRRAQKNASAAGRPR